MKRTCIVRWALWSVAYFYSDEFCLDCSLEFLALVDDRDIGCFGGDFIVIDCNYYLDRGMFGFISLVFDFFGAMEMGKP